MLRSRYGNNSISKKDKLAVSGIDVSGVEYVTVDFSITEDTDDWLARLN